MSETFVEETIRKSMGDVAFDIGANHGHYTNMLSKYFKYVYAFEPFPETVNHLRKKYPQDRVHHHHVHVEELAISNVTGETPLYVSNASDTGHSISEQIVFSEEDPRYWGKEYFSRDRLIMVPCITIDDYCKQHNLIPTLIKMDIEGGEAFAWEGAVDLLTNHNPQILLEIHLIDMPKLETFFKDLGYKFYQDKHQVQHFERYQHYLIKK